MQSYSKASFVIPFPEDARRELEIIELEWLMSEGGGGRTNILSEGAHGAP